eukprot:8244871-Prorocentrum_lima.AAC.1
MRAGRTPRNGAPASSKCASQERVQVHHESPAWLLAGRAQRTPPGCPARWPHCPERQQPREQWHQAWQPLTPCPGHERQGRGARRSGAGTGAGGAEIAPTGLAGETSISGTWRRGGGGGGSSRHRRALRRHGCASRGPEQGTVVLQGGCSCGCRRGGCSSDETLDIRIRGRRTGRCLHRGVRRNQWEAGVVPETAGEPAMGARTATLGDVSEGQRGKGVGGNCGGRAPPTTPTAHSRSAEAAAEELPTPPSGPGEEDLVHPRPRYHHGRNPRRGTTLGEVILVVHRANGRTLASILHLLEQLALSAPMRQDLGALAGNTSNHMRVALPQTLDLSLNVTFLF